MSRQTDVNNICSQLDAAYVGALGLSNDHLYAEKHKILERIRNLQDMLQRYKDSIFVVTPIAIEVTLNTVLRVRHDESQSHQIAELGCQYIEGAIDSAFEFADVDLDVSDISVMEVRDQETDGEYDVHLNGSE